MDIAHGTILCGTSTVPDLDAGLRAYRDVLGLDLVELGYMPRALAEGWGCEAAADARYALLQPKSGAPCWFRLIEQEPYPEYMPMTTHGWAAFECTVHDVASWPEVLPKHLFEVLGLPRTPANLEPSFVAMQTLGPGREMLYLNQVLRSPEDTDLPPARSPVDKIFIAVLAAPDRVAATEWYRRALGFDHAADHTIPYSMINKAFGFPPETLTTLSMVHKGRMPIVEVDGYPDTAAPRSRRPDSLPPGNAMVSFAINDLDSCSVDWISPPASYDGLPYAGNRGAIAIGAAGELVECIEIGRGR